MVFHFEVGQAIIKQVVKAIKAIKAIREQVEQGVELVHGCGVGVDKQGDGSIKQGRIKQVELVHSELVEQGRIARVERVGQRKAKQRLVVRGDARFVFQLGSTRLSLGLFQLGRTQCRCRGRLGGCTRFGTQRRSSR